jgi:FdhD protein
MNDNIDVPAREISPISVSDAYRALPVEAPIAIEYNGIGYAVMMATPTDLEDFALGFSLSERIITGQSQLEAVETVETPDGWLLKIQIAQDLVAPMIARVRVRVSESSCGLCGLENLALINHPLPRIDTRAEISTAAVFAALKNLSAHQPLNAHTGGAHAAAFCAHDGRIALAREDVGRHCAFDKMIGAMARAGLSPAQGFALLSSRCSYELVEKAAIAGFPLLVTISTATSLAVSRAGQAGLRLIALARSDKMLELSRGPAPSSAP